MMLYGFILSLSLLSFGYSQPNAKGSLLIFLSDTQKPTWVEALFDDATHNEQATKNIVSAILQEKNITAVFHAGDVTGIASAEADWNIIRPFIDSLTMKAIPFFAAKGNHDYFLLAPLAMKKFREHIPNGKTEFSQWREGPLQVITLNSNFNQLSDDMYERQKQWYDSVLVSGERDTTLKFIIIVTHYSPYTNSVTVSPSDEVHREFLPAFFRSEKTVLFLSGHAHRFEHFRIEGKDFMVIGGGGGILQKKKKNPQFDDAYKEKDEGTFFHYLRCYVEKQSISIHVVKVSAIDGSQKIVYQWKRRS